MALLCSRYGIYHGSNEGLTERPAKTMLQLTVNGEGRKVEPGTSVTGLVTILGLDGRKIAVERNLVIVPRSQYEHTALADGDRIEIVAFVGGG
jgi:sulfur carrier protein